MWLRKVVGLLDRIVRPPSQVFHKIGGWVLALMMLLTAADVFLRNAFNHPILGTNDLTEYMMAIMVASGLAYVAILKNHIGADVLVTRLSRRTQRVLGVITDFLSFGILVLASWQSFMNMRNVYGMEMTSMVLRIPVFPFMAVVGFGMVLLTLVFLKDFLELFLGSEK